MVDPINEDLPAEESPYVEEIIAPDDGTDYEPPSPAFSGKLWNLFPDGTVEYDGQIGLPSEFPLTEAELAEIENAGEPAVEPPPRPDYFAFWAALLQTDAYQAIRSQSATSLAMNTAATEFIALLADAKDGNPIEQFIQLAIFNVLSVGTFDADHLLEFQAALEAGHLDSIYTLEPPTS
ncbi:MAG: hypothetical protein ACO3PY_06180 [Pontimonas sp.]